MRRLVMIAGLVLLIAVGSFSVTEPHAIIVESSPQADEVVTEPLARLVLRFNSRIVHSLSRVTLVGPDHRKISFSGAVSPAGRPEADRLVLPLPSLPPGTYRLEWRVLAEDGHVTEGGFFFHQASTGGGRRERLGSE